MEFYEHYQEKTVLDDYKTDKVDINYMWAEKKVDSTTYKNLLAKGADNLEKDLRSKSLKTDGAEVLEYNVTRSKINKSVLKKRLFALLMALVIAIGTYSVGKKVVDHVRLEMAYSEACDYMNLKIYDYMNQAGIKFNVDETGNIILENDREKLKVFTDLLENDMDRDVMFLTVSETLGRDAFDKVTQLDGFHDGDDFLRAYYFSGDIYEGGSCVYKYPDYKKFKNNNQVEFIEVVQRIKSEINTKGAK